MGLLERLFGGGKSDGAPSSDDATARALVDRVAATVDKRMLHVRDCQSRLHDAALVTLGHVRSAIIAIPGPVDLDARAWRENPSVRPLFARAEDVAAAFSREPAVRKFFAASSAEHCFALLGLEHTERRVLAPALVDGTLQQEVARTAVSFGSPRVLVPGAAEQPVRVEIAKAAVDYLALRALARATELATKKRELEEEQALLKMKLMLAERAERGLAGFTRGARAAPTTGITQALDKNRKALAAHAPGELLDRLVDILQDVLLHPERYLRFEPRTVTLDAMNFCVQEGAADAATTLHFDRLVLADERAFAVLVARFPRAELAAPVDRMSDAEKYL